MSLHLDILDQHRQDLLPLLEFLKNRFYLAGGTALALQMGHRDSVDFDFFSEQSFDPQVLATELTAAFSDYIILITQLAPETLSLNLKLKSAPGKIIRLSLFYYPYILAKPVIDARYLRLASIEDIGAMKLSAIISRSTLKDYVDLHAILQVINLEGLLSISQKKFPTIDTNLILKALVYFEDIRNEPIKFSPGYRLDRKEMEEFIKLQVQSLNQAQNTKSPQV